MNTPMSITWKEMRTFGTSSLKSLGPQIWNCLPEDLKSANSSNIFKSDREETAHACAKLVTLGLPSFLEQILKVGNT